MKTLMIITVSCIVTFVILVACTDANTKDSADEKKEGTDVYDYSKSTMYTQWHDGHKWVCWHKTPGGYASAPPVGGFTHHPDCPCLNNK